MSRNWLWIWTGVISLTVPGCRSYWTEELRAERAASVERLLHGEGSGGLSGMAAAQPAGNSLAENQHAQQNRERNWNRGAMKRVTHMALVERVLKQPPANLLISLLTSDSLNSLIELLMPLVGILP